MNAPSPKISALHSCPRHHFVSLLFKPNSSKFLITMTQSPGKRWEEWEMLRKENQELRAAIKKWRAEYEHLRKYVESQGVLPSAYPPRSVIREISQSVSPKRKPSLRAKPQNDVVNLFQDTKDLESKSQNTASDNKPQTTTSPQPNPQNMVTRARPKNYPVENLGRDDAIKVSFNHQISLHALLSREN